MNSFQSAMQFVIKWEGGYVNNPNDPGGETNFGIAKRSHPDVDIKHLTLAQAMLIYDRDYWKKYTLDDRPYPYNVVLMDSYVQHKPEKVLSWDQQADGDRRAFLELRRSFYLRLLEVNPKLAVFKNGWLARLNDLDKYVTILEGELS